MNASYSLFANTDASIYYRTSRYGLVDKSKEGRRAVGSPPRSLPFLAFRERLDIQYVLTAGSNYTGPHLPRTARLFLHGRGTHEEQGRETHEASRPLAGRVQAVLRLRIQAGFASITSPADIALPNSVLFAITVYLYIARISK